jgi:TonB-linked SusC/RagA family outer membrane protein
VASGRGAATDLIPTLNASAEPVSVSNVNIGATNFSSANSEQIIFGYFGRVNYDYKRKYLLSFSARYDGASNLGDENKWGFFPGISGGWNVHNEDFWSDPLKISSLKLRASYGVNGNLGNLGDFTAQGQYSVGATYDGVAAVQYTGIANQGLKWEQSKTFDIGFDAGLFDDRIILLFDFYRRVTDNLITTLALPQSTGFTSILTNLGSLENKGFEMEISASIIRTKDFNWDLSFNGSKNKNKILQLPENDNENNRIGGYEVYDPAAGAYVWRGGLQEGSPIGELYAYKQLGIYPTDEAAAQGPTDILVAGSDKSKFGGDVEWLDVDNNGTIDTRDRVRVGNIYPDWTGGISTTAAYKSLSLYARLDYTLGHTIYDYVRVNMNGGFVGGNNNTSDILSSWLNQGDITDVPRFYWADQVAQANYWRGDPRNLNDGRGRSEDYEKGDYLALREITLSYAAPTSWFRSIGLSNLRLNITANNFKYFTSYRGLTPEDGGSNRGQYPVPKSIIFGLKVAF